MLTVDFVLNWPILVDIERGASALWKSGRYGHSMEAVLLGTYRKAVFVLESGREYNLTGAKRDRILRDSSSM